MASSLVGAQGGVGAEVDSLVSAWLLPLMLLCKVEGMPPLARLLLGPEWKAGMQLLCLMLHLMRSLGLGLDQMAGVQLLCLFLLLVVLPWLVRGAAWSR